jgi:hypothetical protein
MYIFILWFMIGLNENVLKSIEWRKSHIKKKEPNWHLKGSIHLMHLF